MTIFFGHTYVALNAATALLGIQQRRKMFQTGVSQVSQ